MILLLGARGYIGQAFARELRARGEAFIPLARAAFDYTRFELLFEYVRSVKPHFIINAGGIWGRPNVDACEEARPETFQANTLLPQTIGRVCLLTNTPWGHVSSACIYSGAKVWEDKSEGRDPKSERNPKAEVRLGEEELNHGWTRMDTDGKEEEPRNTRKTQKTTDHSPPTAASSLSASASDIASATADGGEGRGEVASVAPGPSSSINPSIHQSGNSAFSLQPLAFSLSSPPPGFRVERDLGKPWLRKLFAEHPEYFVGFNESDEPNFTFHHPPCNYMAGTKALAEERLRGRDGVYVWRIGRPFNEHNEMPNLISRLLTYEKVFDHFAPVSHLEDFVRGCLELVERKAPYGVYNVTNPGTLTTRQVVELIERKLKPDRRFQFWEDEREFYKNGARAPRSSCVIDSGKIARAGVKLRPAWAALEDAVERWGNGGRWSVASGRWAGKERLKAKG